MKICRLIIYVGRVFGTGCGEREFIETGYCEDVRGIVTESSMFTERKLELTIKGKLYSLGCRGQYIVPRIDAGEEVILSLYDGQVAGIQIVDGEKVKFRFLPKQRDLYEGSVRHAFSDMKHP